MDSLPLPKIKNTLIDSRTKVTFDVFAHRPLAIPELRQAVAQHLALRRKLRTLPNSGDVVTFVINVGPMP
jgi:hypothetical protein